MTGIAGVGAVRAAEAMLEALGGTQATLLFPAAGLPGDAGSQLGMLDPGVVQAPIAPVIVRELPTESNGPRRRIELVMGRSALSDVLSQRNVASGEVLLQTALGVLWQGEVFHIEGFVIERFAGVEYLYRVTAVE